VNVPDRVSGEPSARFPARARLRPAGATLPITAWKVCGTLAAPSSSVAVTVTVYTPSSA
jgi:hypothetical protein